MKIIENAIREGRKALSEFESKALLKDYGIPVTREQETRGRSAFIKALDDIGYPLVIKASDPDITHKTEKGLVRVDVRNEQEALSAFEDVCEKTGRKEPAVLVQEMLPGPRELVVGLTRDQQFGPCVMFGLGGIFTEILRDVSFRVAPLETRDAMEMMTEIRGRKILDSVRGMPAADLESIADILKAVGTIGLELEQIKEIDINPLILSGERPVAADAVVILNGDGGAEEPAV